MTEGKPLGKIELQRRTVTVNASTSPVVFFAQETIAWKGGNVPICGLGVSRAEALIAADAQFENLKKILGAR